jgi:hypothetical protein
MDRALLWVWGRRFHLTIAAIVVEVVGIVLWITSHNLGFWMAVGAGWFEVVVVLLAGPARRAAWRLNPERDEERLNA